MNDEDMDDDGFSNDVENSCSSDPRDAVSTPDDFDGDGTCNGLDKDDDNDGLDDVFENGEIQDNCRLTPSNSLVVEIQMEMDITMMSHKRKILMAMASSMFKTIVRRNSVINQMVAKK